jgi:hypothetical protein
MISGGQVQDRWCGSWQSALPVPAQVRLKRGGEVHPGVSVIKPFRHYLPDK